MAIAPISLKLAPQNRPAEGPPGIPFLGYSRRGLNVKTRICIVFNPTAKGDKARHFRRHLDEFGQHCELKPTWAPGAATALAAAAVREGFTTIVAAGGDGTLNEVLNGITQEPQGLAQVRLGLIPLGTVNVFAHELSLPRRLATALACILDGPERRIDLGRVEMGEKEPATVRHFLQLGGAGLDAQAVALVNWELKKKIGKFAYVWAGFAALRLPRPLVTVTTPTQEVRGELVLIGNGRYYGGPLTFFPGARLDDGELDLCVFPRTNWPTITRCLISAVFRARRQEVGLRALRASAFSLASSTPAQLELDGEHVGQLPARFSVLPQALRIIAPA